MSEPTSKDAPVSTASPAPRQRQFSCSQCGANLAFAPGTLSLACPYCGTHNQVRPAEAPVEELDYAQQLLRLEQNEDIVEVLAVHCDTCGAESALSRNETSGACPFCGAGIVAQAASRRQIKPRALLPFHIARTDANNRFKTWIAGLWFAPSDLRKQARQAGINGVYLPFWTYDTRTTTDYTGERGDDYWTAESYTTHENGRAVTRTRQVKRTRWTRTAGRVANKFDDVLVAATDALPHAYVQALEPWDLANLTGYSDEYLGGFIAQSYDVDLPSGFVRAQALMEPTIRGTIRQDIGGDHQRIGSTSTAYFDITFKHLLLPVWISAYRYGPKSYRFLVNARTGEVQGERPYSWIKIALFILSLLIVAIGFYLVISSG